MKDVSLYVRMLANYSMVSSLQYIAVPDNVLDATYLYTPCAVIRILCVYVKHMHAESTNRLRSGGDGAEAHGDTKSDGLYIETM